MPAGFDLFTTIEAVRTGNRPEGVVPSQAAIVIASSESCDAIWSCGTRLVDSSNIGNAASHRIGDRNLQTDWRRSARLSHRRDHQNRQRPSQQSYRRAPAVGLSRRVSDQEHGLKTALAIHRTGAPSVSRSFRETFQTRPPTVGLPLISSCCNLKGLEDENRRRCDP